MQRPDFPKTQPWIGTSAAVILIAACFGIAAPRISAAELSHLASLSREQIRWPSLVRDSQDHLHVAYRFCTNDASGFEYGRQTANGWTFELVPNASGYNASLAVDAQGNAHVAYFDPGNPVVLRYASRSTRGWAAETVESAGELTEVTTGNTSIALDRTGRPHLAYSVNGALKYAAKTSSGWIVETVDATGSPASGRHPSLSLDGLGNPKISYSDAKGLILAQRQGRSWSFTTVDANSSRYTALGVDARGAALSSEHPAQEQ